MAGMKVAILEAVNAAAQMPGPGEGYGMGPGMMWGYGMGWFWPFVMLLVPVAVVVAIIIIVRLLVSSMDRNRTSGPAESALDILRKRYARGEIGKEEYEEKKKDLEG